MKSDIKGAESRTAMRPHRRKSHKPRRKKPTRFWTRDGGSGDGSGDGADGSMTGGEEEGVKPPPQIQVSADKIAQWVAGIPEHLQGLKPPRSESEEEETPMKRIPVGRPVGKPLDRLPIKIPGEGLKLALLEDEDAEKNVKRPTLPDNIMGHLTGGKKDPDRRAPPRKPEIDPNAPPKPPKGTHRVPVNPGADRRKKPRPPPINPNEFDKIKEEAEKNKATNPQVSQIKDEKEENRGPPLLAGGAKDILAFLDGTPHRAPPTQPEKEDDGQPNRGTHKVGRLPVKLPSGLHVPVKDPVKVAAHIEQVKKAQAEKERLEAEENEAEGREVAGVGPELPVESREAEAGRPTTSECD